MIELTSNIQGKSKVKGQPVIIKAGTQRKTVEDFRELMAPEVFESAMIVRKIYKDVKVGAKPSDAPKK